MHIEYLNKILKLFLYFVVLEDILILLRELLENYFIIFYEFSVVF